MKTTFREIVASSLAILSGSGPTSVLAGASLTLMLLAGCSSKSGGSDGGYQCTPACPVGSHCGAEGCVVDSPADFAVDSQAVVGCSPACSGATPICNPQNVCVACLVDGDCPSGQVCKQSGSVTVCVAGCSDNARCGGEPNACCNGGCADTSSDPSNCGGCGTSCNANHAASSCTLGRCTVGACDSGWGDCNNDSTDGCETNLLTDVKNCGACGTTCKIANALAACSGTCYIAACNFGFDDCNAKVEDGCETSVTSDVKNCGACGNSCPAKPHAKSTCLNSACQLSSCDQGYSDCNQDPGDGCEVQTGTDKNNCGKCGNSCGQGLVCINSSCTCPMCNFPNAKSACVNLVCSMGECLPGWADCNNNPKDGCEQNIATDKLNCGACGNACPMNLPGCVDGVCVMGCLNGMQPPKSCAMGNDPETMSQYVVCSADCMGAWITAAPGGGSYHAKQICQLFGYSDIGRYGGTCGSQCARCDNNFSCMNPQMNTNFDNGGNSGNDQFGIILAKTVHWECKK